MQKYQMGWLPSRPDFRDYSIETAVQKLQKQGTPSTQEVIKLKRATFAEDDNSPILNRAIQLLQTPIHKSQRKANLQEPYLVLPLKASANSNQNHQSLVDSEILDDLYLPESVDLRGLFSPVEKQGKLNSCTAHAGVALVEYFQRRAFGEYIDASPLFLYKTTRRLMQLTGDSGASIHYTMRAMMLFGIPPEEACPYYVDAFDEEPSNFSYAYGQNYQAINYFNIDRYNLSPEQILVRIRIALAAGFPPMFGFTAYSSLFSEKTEKSGKIPYPANDEKVVGGHAVVAVGYDDRKVIRGSRTPGAFRIRNSWGQKWGKDGYGWLPYDYVLNRLAIDWWSLVKSEWVASENFGLTVSSDGLLEACDCVPGTSGCDCKPQSPVM